jgi:hypothetical protein
LVILEENGIEDSAGPAYLIGILTFKFDSHSLLVNGFCIVFDYGYNFFIQSGKKKVLE